MKRFLKSLFGGNEGGEGSEGGEAAPAGIASAEVSGAGTPQAEAPGASEGGEHSLAAITDDLVAQICSTMPDPRPANEIDHHVHMFDAGYVTSISAADLLAHIQTRYGLDITETKLIGPLQNIEALANYIKNPTP
ncbi:MAG: acyl carrier protein [Myxococcota bacterium]|jgi:acyl carrier protein|nr:acyl carrier protein [Myxococcota bacterium]